MNGSIVKLNAVMSEFLLIGTLRLCERMSYVFPRRRHINLLRLQFHKEIIKYTIVYVSLSVVKTITKKSKKSR